MTTLSTRTNLSSLNDMQRKAVLSDAKRVLVLAGAGSGKTKTLLQKIHYLLDDLQADSSSILALTFTQNAALEMLDRMIISADKTGYYQKVLSAKGLRPADLAVVRKEMLSKFPWLSQITFKTFHGLCYQIMREDGVQVFDNQFKVISDGKSEKTSSSAPETEHEIIQKCAIKLSENKDYLMLMKKYILDYHVDYIAESESSSEFRPEGKLFTTLKGDKVRSKSEQYIADWLYRHSIEYKYEKAERVGNKSFHPDFFIPQANIYLEHVSDLSYPTFWKEEEMKKGGSTCIKTFDKVSQNTAVFNQVLDKVIKGRISNDISSTSVLYYHEEFAGFKKELKKFFRLVLDVKSTIRSSNKTLDQIKKEAASSKHERVRLFYKVALPIIDEYYQYCTNSSYLDFDGFIEYSIELFKKHPAIRERYQNRFKYVLVDEFQDVNNQQVDLLKLIIKDDSQLFCVGDDWQSIYGFRGSEVDYILNFKKHFSNPDIIKLNLNYRSTDHIVNASNEFIKKNKNQILKEVRAVQKGGQKIHVHYAEHTGHSESFIWEKISEHIAEGASPDQILILYRRSAMAESIKLSLKRSNVQVQFKTIHGAKGLEARVVFILGLHGAKGGFPDPWMQDKIYQIIKTTEYDMLLEEERRLFYVAVTRAKEHLYLISQKGSVSSFVKDLPKENINLTVEEEMPGENRIILCSGCECKVEDHFNFCPECGVNLHTLETAAVDSELENLKSKICLIPLKHSVDLSQQIIASRKKHPRAYEPWRQSEDEILISCFDKFRNKELEEIFGRSANGIKTRFELLTEQNC